MKLKELSIQLNESWQDSPGQYRSTIVWETEKGTLKFNIPTEVSTKLLAFIGPLLGQYSKESAEQMANAICQSAIEAANPALLVESEGTK